MKILLSIFVAALAYAQPSGLRVEGATATQIVISYIPPSVSACTAELSESASYSPLVHDVDTAIFSGSNSDTRSVTSGARRYFILGTRTGAAGADGKIYSRALAAATPHFGRVTCGSAVAFTATTGQISGIAPEELPVAAGSYLFPEWSFTQANRGAALIDPQTGARYYRVTDPRDLSAVQDRSFASGSTIGGSGWTNPDNITSAATSPLASTTNTNPIFVPINSSTDEMFGYSFYQANGSLVDLGARVFGQGSDATAGNRQVSICISVDSQTCYTSSVTVTLPQTTSANVGTFPTTFPTAGVANATWEPFVGWGKIIGREYLAGGSVSASAGTVTLTLGPKGGGVTSQDAASGFFHQEWPVGSKLYFAGSDPTCTNNFCTIASVTDSTHLVISENLTLGGNNAYRFAGVGLLVAKTNATGTVSISLGYSIAKSFGMQTDPSNGCSPTTVTANVDRAGSSISPGVVGYLCLFSRARSNFSTLYFVGRDVPDFRLLSQIRPPTTLPMGYTMDDWPYPLSRYGPNSSSSFDPTDANVLYVGASTWTGGYKAIFKLTYTGDYRETTGLFFAGNNEGDYPTYVADNVTWENLTRASTGADLRTKILAGSPTYDETLWGSIAGSGLTYAGVAAGKAIFYHNVASQDDACWIFVFDGATGNYETGFNTVTGSGAPGGRFGGCHSIGPVLNQIGVANNGLNRNSSGTLYGGPFQVVPTHVYKAGVTNTNTSLPTTTDGSYSPACDFLGTPDAQWIALGATGNKCVTIRFATEPCSAVPTAAEKAATPCPGDSNSSYIGSNLAPGDELIDTALGGDGEHLLMVKRTAVSGNIFDATFLRDAGRGYCCLISAATIPDRCSDSDGQAVHANGWTARAMPLGSCTGNTQFYPPTALTTLFVEDQNLTRGHFGYEKVTPTAMNNMAVGGVSYYRGRYNALNTDIGTFAGTFQLGYAPTFSGTALNISVVQSYVTATPGGVAWDWRHANGGTGVDIEYPGQTLGPTLTFTNVTGNLWRVSGFTAPTSIKVDKWAIWAGSYPFLEKSSASTGDTIASSDNGRFCFTYRAGECRTGSSAGYLYFVVPGLESSMTVCNASQIAKRSPCVFPAGPLLGSIVQLDATQSDVTAQRQRKVGTGLTGYGSQYVYTKLRPISAAVPNKVLSTAYHQSDLWSGAVMIDAGQWNPTSANASDYAQIPVQIPALAGTNQARVRFGYAEYGTAGTNFYCMARAEDCVTDASLSPYAFAGDSLTATTCSSGCTINIPAVRGRMLLFRVERLNSGTLVSTGPLQVMAVQ